MKKLPALLLGLSLAAATLVSAQTPPADGARPPHRGGPGGHGRGPGSPLVRVLDADHDGEISAAEIANASAALLTLDKNGDKMLSADELHPPRPADAPADAPPPPHGDRPHPVDPIMLALDANGDGVLSEAEIRNAPASLAALDLNKDGKLTRDEFHPLPPKRD